MIMTTPPPMTMTIQLLLQYAIIVAIAVTLLILLKPIIWPVIITFPWEEEETTSEEENTTKKTKKNDDDDDAKQQQQQHQEQEQRTVILAGSYNPPHLGHLAMLEYLSKRYRHVIAVVGFNPNKKYDVTPTQRKTILEEMIKTTTAINIQVELVEGYIWRYAKKVNATIFFRGIRSWSKDGHDERSLQILNTWGPMLLGPLVWPIPTIYLEGNPKYNHVSSTLIRNLCCAEQQQQKQQQQQQLDELVPKNLVAMITEIYGKKVQ